MNYLALCQKLVRELGVNGLVGPSSVLSQKGELSNIVDWIADADVEIALEYHDWKFLWFEHTEVLSVDSRDPHGPSNLIPRRYDRQSFFLDKDQPTKKILRWRPYEQFRGRYDVGAIRSTQPRFVTTLPNNQLRLDAIPNQPYTLWCEGWRVPQRMAGNNDPPNVPADFARIVIARAKAIYGAREDAPELLADGDAEYYALLKKLEAGYLPNQEQQATGADDADLHVEVDYRTYP